MKLLLDFRGCLVPWLIPTAFCACVLALSPAARAQTQPLLQITSPADGTVVHPGDTVTVVVTPAAGVTFQAVTIFAHDPLICDQVLSAPPYDFSVQVPAAAPAGSYGLVASGAIAPGQLVNSPLSDLDVEPSAAVSSIQISPPSLTFVRAGEYLPLSVTAHFSDGSTMDVTKSTDTKYTSSDTNVATVTPYGLVTAVGTGCGPGGACVGVGMIYVSFSGKTVPVQISTSALKVPTDTTPPATTASVSPQPNAAGWNNSDVTVTLDATDTGTGASGVQQITYSATGAQTIASTNFTGSSTTLAISTEGTTTITYSATDNVGNIEPNQTLVVNLDKTPPAVNCGTPDTQWHAANVSISCTASDSLSGLAQASDASFTLSTDVPAGTETANASTNSLSVCDVAGNCSNAGPISGVMVDRKPPVITITTPGSNNPSYLLNQAVAASYSCTDGGSGVATCKGTAPSGSNLSTSAVGAETFSVNATDNVGNASNQSESYSVSYNVCLLYDPTKAVESNATIPIKFDLCDANSTDASSSAIAVNLTGIQQISTATSGEVVTYPAASPDVNFRYSSDLGPTGGYIMNLSTKGYAAGTYQITFTVTNDPIPHSVQFEVSQ